ncbi:MAG: arylsulfotransferase (ASST) [Deltaproteobacteria bacterium]|nr:arylsulfotransferase (ASST) [Deltaproteobacteria bacterium]
MTRSKSTFHVSPLSTMAAMVFTLLILGLFHVHAGAASIVSDIKLNGMDGKLNISSATTLSATVQLDSGDETGENAEWWIVAETPMGWYYYAYPDMWHFSEDGMESLMPAYEGALFTITEPLTVLRMTGLPVGAYVFYFGVDTAVNGRMDLETMIYDRGDLEVATTDAAFDGYNLFAPMRSKTTYLIDNNGNTVHSWAGDYSPGVSVYLLEDGTLLRTADTGDETFNVGGAGGRVERLGWEGVRQWEFEYRSDQYRLHHDIEVLPNGNVLMIAWEMKTETEAIAAGRNPSLLGEGELWPDHVIEVAPTGTSGGNIVWEWHVWDHLIQDYDEAKENYGNVGDHPELIDLNYTSTSDADWNHINAVDYNADLDQIVLSVHGFSEIWVIDHSTITSQAAGHAGGKSGKGGDLLYRWGNPQTYDAGDTSDQQLFVQHDAKWIETGLPGEDHILIFNNGQGRPEGNYSSVDEIVPPVNSDGGYTFAGGAAYGPTAPTWRYTATPPTDFYAQNISGAQRLPNGNTLICQGPDGLFFEVTESGEKVWEYDYGGAVFRVNRYSPYYAGFIGTDLASGATPVP